MVLEQVSNEVYFVYFLIIFLMFFTKMYYVLLIQWQSRGKLLTAFPIPSIRDKIKEQIV